MLKKIREAAQAIERLNINEQHRSELIAISMAHRIALTLSLPPAAVDNINAYYGNYHRNNVVKCLNELNELQVFNVNQAMMLTEKFYVLRFAFVFRPQYFSTDRALLTLASTDDRVMPENVIDLLSSEESRQKMNQLGSSLMHILNEHDLTADEPSQA